MTCCGRLRLFFWYSIDGRSASEPMDTDRRKTYVVIGILALCRHQARRGPLNRSREPPARNRLVWPNFGERFGPDVFRYAPHVFLAKDTYARVTDFYERRQVQTFFSKAQCFVRCNETALCTRLRLCLDGVHRQFGLLIKPCLCPEHRNQTEGDAKTAQHKNTEAQKATQILTIHTRPRSD